MVATASKRRPTRGRESLAAARTRASLILDRLHATYPEARCELDYHNPYELVMATILSAQCTDQRVNMVTPVLFRRYPAPVDLAQAHSQELETIIRSTGFFRAKAKSLMGCAQALVQRHGGQVPRTMAELVKLPGVGRKTANVVLGHAFDIAEGIAVDTHVLRVAARLGLTTGDDPLEVEARLMEIVPRERWTLTTDLVIFHGRRVCDARRPQCGRCSLFDLCRFDQRQAWALGQTVSAKTKPVTAKQAKARRGAGFAPAERRGGLRRGTPPLADAPAKRRKPKG